VISTQLIEAGVDVDFPTVFRSIAGIDSIAQSAGRCNRNGRQQSGEVYIFEPSDSPSPKIFRQYIQTAQEVTRKYDDILSQDAVKDYFERLYKEKGDLLDSKKIINLLEKDVNNLNFPFKEIASRFRMIESETHPVIIRYNDEAEKLIRDLAYSEFSGTVLRKLQKYTVQIYEYEFKEIQDSLEPVNGFFIADKRLYNSETGLMIFENFNTTEGFII
jgi:CRISPR-associated endonuclease/helicase Cas3